jgi:hypothetical protein
MSYPKRVPEEVLAEWIQEGRMAHQQGLSIDHNPWPDQPGTHRAAWRLGWLKERGSRPQSTDTFP